MKDVSIKDVFISYRRDSGAMMAHHLHHWLANDGYAVFLDAQLGSGRFDKELYKRIEECTDFLLVVSPNGFDRCNDPKDWVRREIEHALHCGKNIVPVIMPGCEIPEDLPESIQEIKQCEYVEIYLKLEKAVFELLEQKFMLSKPRVSVADLDVVELNGPDRQPNTEGMSLHEQMSQQALRDTSNNADDHIMAIHASQGDAESQFRLWNFYHRRNDEFSEPTKEMMYWLKQAVTQNHPKAICCMGKCYYHGYGVEQTPAKAVIFFRKSLEFDENLTEAMCSLGDCYLNGIGVEPSVVQAANLYKQAMEAGDSSAAGKYIELLRTANAVKKLKAAHIAKKIKAIIQKKENKINYEQALRLLAVRLLGVIRYGSLRRFRLLADQGHTMDQISEDQLQKYRHSIDHTLESWSKGLLIAYFVLFLGVCSIVIDGQPFLDAPAVAEIKEFFAGIDIPNSVREFLVPIGKWLEVFLGSPVPGLFLIGVFSMLTMTIMETYKDPQAEYWNTHKKVRKFLVPSVVFLLLFHFANPDIALLAMILYLIVPHKIYAS